MKRLLVLLALLALVGGAAFAQTQHNVILNSVALGAVILNNGADVTMSLTVPTAGLDPQGSTDVSKRIWYTFISTGTSRISANWRVTDAAPAGTSLSLQAVPEALAGTGQTVTFPDLSAVAQDIVTLIPSVATGQGVADGAALTYSYNVVTPASLTVGAATTVQISFTVTAS